MDFFIVFSLTEEAETTFHMMQGNVNYVNRDVFWTFNQSLLGTEKKIEQMAPLYPLKNKVPANSSKISKLKQQT